MSEGDLTQPISPDYMPPTAEITYELESKVGERWSQINLELACADPKNLKEIQEVRDRLVAQGYKARITRVETIRSQMPS